MCAPRAVLHVKVDLGGSAWHCRDCRNFGPVDVNERHPVAFRASAMAAFEPFLEEALIPSARRH